MNIYDHGVARHIADAAIARVGKNSDPEWFATAMYAVRKLAMSREHFTTDELWCDIDHPREPRAIGAVMRQAKRDGLCVATLRYEHSRRVACHARPLRVWASMIYGKRGFLDSFCSRDVETGKFKEQ